MRGSRILATLLEAAGVEYAFGLAGSAILGLLDEIGQSEVSFVTTRHEQVATGMAVGYGLATRRPAVSIAHVGPGAANQVLGVAAAYRENIPLIAISGNEPSHRLGRSVRHEWDVTGVFERFTKHNVRVRSHRPGDEIRDAILRSVTGIPGPVHIDFPRDLEEADLPPPDETSIEGLESRDIRTPMNRARPLRGAIRSTVDSLTEADEPVVLAGSEVRWSAATEDLLRFVESVNIPVVTSKTARGAIPESHRLSLGMVGRPGLEPTNDYVRGSDLVLAVGARFSDLNTLNWELVSDEAVLVHVTQRARELDRQYMADTNILCDPASFLSDLTDAIDGEAIDFSEQALAAREACETARQRFLDPEIEPAEQGVDPRKVVLAVDRVVDDYVFTTGGGVHAHFPNRLPVDDINGTFGTPNFSGMAQGFPLAMGARLALDRPVFTFEGDGGFAMVMQDLETAVREAIPVKVVVFNNESYMSQRARQHQFYGERYVGSTFSNPDFAAVAEDFGAFGRAVTEDEQLADAVEELVDFDGPGVLDVHIDPWLDTAGYGRD